jgi:hypothetical protein
VVGAVVVAGMTLAACGGSSGNGEASKSGNQVFSDAKKATATASSLHISGNLTDSGSLTGLDLEVGQGSGSGTITEKGATFDVVVHGKTLYLKADAATWTKAASAAAAKVLADKWIDFPSTSSDFSSFADLTSITKLTQTLTSSGKLAAPVKTTFQGKSAVKVVDTGSKKGVLYVAATGKPYILAIMRSGSTHGTIVFDGYNSAKIAGVPAGAKTITQLEQSAG